MASTSVSSGGWFFPGDAMAGQQGLEAGILLAKLLNFVTFLVAQRVRWSDILFIAHVIVMSRSLSQFVAIL